MIEFKDVSGSKSRKTTIYLAGPIRRDDMTYPPQDYYEKDRKRVIRFLKYFSLALITTIIVYYIIDKLLLYLRGVIGT